MVINNVNHFNRVYGLRNILDLTEKEMIESDTGKAGFSFNMVVGAKTLAIGLESIHVSSLEDIYSATWRDLYSNVDDLVVGLNTLSEEALDNVAPLRAIKMKLLTSTENKHTLSSYPFRATELTGIFSGLTGYSNIPVLMDSLTVIDRLFSDNTIVVGGCSVTLNLNGEKPVTVSKFTPNPNDSKEYTKESLMEFIDATITLNDHLSITAMDGSTHIGYTKSDLPHEVNGVGVEYFDRILLNRVLKAHLLSTVVKCVIKLLKEI